MAKCKKLKEYLEQRRGEYDFSKVKKFLESCCGLVYRRNKDGHHYFYLINSSPFDMETIISFADDHKKNPMVKRSYVKDMWRDLNRLGIEPRED